MKRFLIVIRFSLIILCVNRTEAFYIAEQDSFDIIKPKTDYLHRYTWSSTPFIAAGYGLPQGFRGETGYTFGDILTLGMSFGIGDSWSFDPWEGTIAWFARLNIPIENTHAGFYFSILSGSNIAIFGDPDSYTLANIGLIYPLSDYMHLRPEFGIAFTSKYISGGKGNGIFGSSPLITEDRTVVSFNLNFELDLRPLLWSSW